MSKSDSKTTAKPPLPAEALHQHVMQCIQERLNLGHLYEITSEEDGFEASCRPEAAASVWRVTWDAIREAGWQIVRFNDGRT